MADHSFLGAGCNIDKTRTIRTGGPAGVEEKPGVAVRFVEFGVPNSSFTVMFTLEDWETKVVPYLTDPEAAEAAFAAEVALQQAREKIQVAGQLPPGLRGRVDPLAR